MNKKSQPNQRHTDECVNLSTMLENNLLHLQASKSFLL